MEKKQQTHVLRWTPSEHATDKLGFPLPGNVTFWWEEKLNDLIHSWEDNGYYVEHVLAFHDCFFIVFQLREQES